MNDDLFETVLAVQVGAETAVAAPIASEGAS